VPTGITRIARGCAAVNQALEFATHNLCIVKGLASEIGRSLIPTLRGGDPNGIDGNGQRLPEWPKYAYDDPVLHLDHPTTSRPDEKPSCMPHNRTPLRACNWRLPRSTPDFHRQTGNARKMLEIIRDQNHSLRYRV
jgi:hypothetical protein